MFILHFSLQAVPVSDLVHFINKTLILTDYYHHLVSACNLIHFSLHPSHTFLHRILQREVGLINQALAVDWPSAVAL